MNNSVPFYGKGLPCLSIHQWWTVGVFFFNLVMSQALPFNNSADFCVNECFQFLWYITRLKCLGYMITPQFLFWSALKSFPGCTLWKPYPNIWGFQFFHPNNTYSIPCNHPEHCEMLFHCNCDLNFLNSEL